MKRKQLIILLLAVLLTAHVSWAQPQANHYATDGKEILKKNGKNLFIRPLYSTNKDSFTIWASETPEIGFTIPQQAGVLKFGFVNGSQYKWLSNADSVQFSYDGVSVKYTIRDKLIGGGTVVIEARPTNNEKNPGCILKITSRLISRDAQLMVTYGGASGISGNDSLQFYPLSVNAAGNEYEIVKNGFQSSFCLRGADSCQPQNIRHLYLESSYPFNFEMAKANAAENLQSLDASKTGLTDTQIVKAKMKFAFNPEVYIYLKPGLPDANDKNIKFKDLFLQKSPVYPFAVNTPDAVINLFARMLGPTAAGSQLSVPDYYVNAASGSSAAVDYFSLLGQSAFPDSGQVHYPLVWRYTDQLTDYLLDSRDSLLARSQAKFLLKARNLLYRRQDIAWYGPVAANTFPDSLYSQNWLNSFERDKLHKINNLWPSLQLNTENSNGADTNIFYSWEKGRIYDFVLPGLNIKQDKFRLQTLNAALGSPSLNPFQKSALLHAMQEVLPIWENKNGRLLYANSPWLPYTDDLGTVSIENNYLLALNLWENNQPEKAMQIWNAATAAALLDGRTPGAFPSRAPGKYTLPDANDDPYVIKAGTDALIKGLFGIHFLKDSCFITPSFPPQWKNAAMSSATVDFQMAQSKNRITYTLDFRGKSYKPAFRIPIAGSVNNVSINGSKTGFRQEAGIGNPVLVFSAGTAATKMKIVMDMAADSLKITLPFSDTVSDGGAIAHTFDKAINVTDVYDPQQLLSSVKTTGNGFSANVSSNKRPGKYIYFTLEKQQDASWWCPQTIFVTESQAPGQAPENGFISKSTQTVNIYAYFNEKINNFLKGTYPERNGFQVNDSGLRAAAGEESVLTLPNGFRFLTPFASATNNVAIIEKGNTAFPDSLNVSLDGSTGRYLSIMMANTANPLFSGLHEGIINIYYTDGTMDSFPLNLNKTLWPVEQDLAGPGIDTAARATLPIRYSLKFGKLYEGYGNDNQYLNIRHVPNRFVDGGAANVINLPIIPKKRLRQVVIQPIVPGLRLGIMGITLLKDIVDIDENTVKGPEQQIRYLSGTDSENPANWEFNVSNGRKSDYWNYIPVPGVWEQSGFGTYNYGLDARMFGPAYPIAKESGRYRLAFQVPAEWKGQKVSLNFDGVATDISVKINNKNQPFTHKGGYVPFFFDVTDVVNYGKNNTLDITVSKVSSDENINNTERNGAFWIFGGIYKPVYLTAMPKASFRDVRISAHADGSVKIYLRPNSIVPNENIRVAILTENGQPAGNFSKMVNVNDSVITLTAKINDIHPWNFEQPNRYTAQISLVSENKTMYEQNIRFGFRNYGISKENGITLNGVPVKIKGINYHVNWPDKGIAVSDNQLLADLYLIKSMNMNCVRVLNGAADHRLLEYCDSLGLMVISVLPGEETGYNLRNASEILPAMVNDGQNHPSLFLWESEPEDSYTDSIVRSNDLDNREVIHSGKSDKGLLLLPGGSFDSLNKILDNGNLVLPVQALPAAGDGGGGAGLAAYWHLVKSTPRLAGVIINEYSDNGLLRTDQNSRIDVTHPGLGEGITGPYREKEGSYYTLKQLFAGVSVKTTPITDTFNGQLAIGNNYAFTHLNDCIFSSEWVQFRQPGDNTPNYQVMVKNYEKGPSLKPGEQGMMNVTMPRQNLSNYDALIIRVFEPVTTREIYQWSIPVAHGYTAIDTWVSHTKTEDPSSATFTEDSAAFLLHAGPLSIGISKNSGMLQSVHKYAPVSLKNGPYPAAGQANLTGISAAMNGKDAVVSANYSGSLKSVKWILKANGWLQVDYTYRADSNNALSGVSFNYPESEVISVKWLGDGPSRIWADRKEGPSLNVWEQFYNNSATGLSPWKYPEFKGYFGNFRWMQLNTSEGRLLFAATDKKISFRLFDAYAVYAPKKLPALPAGNISFMDKIPPAGNLLSNGKMDYVHPGPSNSGNEWITHTLYLYFGE